MAPSSPLYSLRTTIYPSGHETRPPRFRDPRRVLPADPGHRPLLRPARPEDDARLLSVATHAALVARGHRHGGDDVLRRHPARRHRDGDEAGRRRQLVMVVVPRL